MFEDWATLEEKLIIVRGIEENCFVTFHNSTSADLATINKFAVYHITMMLSVFGEDELLDKYLKEKEDECYEDTQVH